MKKFNAVIAALLLLVFSTPLQATLSKKGTVSRASCEAPLRGEGFIKMSKRCNIPIKELRAAYGRLGYKKILPFGVKIKLKSSTRRNVKKAKTIKQTKPAHRQRKQPQAEKSADKQDENHQLQIITQARDEAQRQLQAERVKSAKLEDEKNTLNKQLQEKSEALAKAEEQLKNTGAAVQPGNVTAAGTNEQGAASADSSSKEEKSEQERTWFGWATETTQEAWSKFAALVIDSWNLLNNPRVFFSLLGVAIWLGAILWFTRRRKGEVSDKGTRPTPATKGSKKSKINFLSIFAATGAFLVWAGIAIGAFFMKVGKKIGSFFLWLDKQISKSGPKISAGTTTVYGFVLTQAHGFRARFAKKAKVEVPAPTGLNLDPELAADMNAEFAALGDEAKPATDFRSVISEKTTKHDNGSKVDYPEPAEEAVQSSDNVTEGTVIAKVVIPVMRPALKAEDTNTPELDPFRDEAPDELSEDQIDFLNSLKGKNIKQLIEEVENPLNIVLEKLTQREESWWYYFSRDRIFMEKEGIAWKLERLAKQKDRIRMSLAVAARKNLDEESKKPILASGAEVATTSA